MCACGAVLCCRVPGADGQAKLAQLNPSFAKRHAAPLAPPAASMPSPPSASATSHHSYLISPVLGMNPVSLSSSVSSSSNTALRPDGDSDSALRPDGDSDLGSMNFSHFIVPSCPVCTDGAGRPLRDAATTADLPLMQHGVLKPDLVFFGANVPKPVHARADELLNSADGLLIVGTSLTVWSAFRLVRHVLHQAFPGHERSVLQLAEEMARSGGPTLIGSNTIVNGSTTIGPLLSSEAAASSVRVPSRLPIVVVNCGPTRLDPLLPFASNIVKVDHTRASHALRVILDFADEPLQPHGERHARDHHLTARHPNIE